MAARLRTHWNCARIAKIVRVKATLALYVFCAFGASAQRMVAVPAQKLPFGFKNYYFSEVVDARAATSNVGLVLESGLPVALQVRNGLVKTLSDWAQTTNTPPDTTRIAVRISVEACKITELKKADGTIEGKLVFTLVFERPRDQSAVFLVRLSGGSTFKRTATVANMAETVLRQSFARGFVGFNDWFVGNYGLNHNLVKGIKLVVLPDYTPSDAAKDDTVFFARRRPIAWKDFQAGVHFGSRYAAAIYSSFSYEGKSRVRPDGYLEVGFQTKTFMIKSSSWTKHTDETPYSLAHEQLHFDITHLIAQRFKAKVISMNLDWEDYDSEIQFQYLEFFREMNRVQLQYDEDTNHSLARDQQGLWAAKVARELEKYGIKDR